AAASQIGTFEVGIREADAQRLHPTAEVCAFEVRADEQGVANLRRYWTFLVVELLRTEISSFEIGEAQVGVVDIDRPEVGAAKVFAAQIITFDIQTMPTGAFASWLIRQPFGMLGDLLLIARPNSLFMCVNHRRSYPFIGPLCVEVEFSARSAVEAVGV